MKALSILISLTSIVVGGAFSASAGEKSCLCSAVIDKDDPFNVTANGIESVNVDYAKLEVRYTTPPACTRPAGNCPKPTVTWRWTVSSTAGVKIEGADNAETVKVNAATGGLKEFTLTVTVSLECKTSVGAAAEEGGTTVMAIRKQTYEAKDTLYLGK